MQWREAKRSNKVKVAAFLREKTGYSVSPDAMFDIQVRRHLHILFPFPFTSCFDWPTSFKLGMEVVPYTFITTRITGIPSLFIFRI